jgi:hypothetical protein
MLVADATGGGDTNLVMAALLHDAIEDCEVPQELCSLLAKIVTICLPAAATASKENGDAFYKVVQNENNQ